MMEYFFEVHNQRIFERPGHLTTFRKVQENRSQRIG